MKKTPTRAMGFGTFDGLHPGHVRFLEQLRQLGDEVFVVIARDSNVLKIKGKKPRFTEKERLEAVRQSGLVDEAILGNPTNFYQCLTDHKPDVIGLGYDQRANTEAITAILPNVRIVRLKAFKPEEYKSSLIPR